MPFDIKEKLREMNAQQQLIEQKKREIQSKLAEEKSQDNQDQQHNSST
jgi:hypothetical protein